MTLYLLSAALAPRAQAQDIQRLLKIRSAFASLDWEDASISGLRSCLLRAFLHPLFLKSNDGSRFLAFALSLHPSIPYPVYAVWKNLLPAAPQSTAKNLAKVLYKAWAETGDSASSTGGNFAANTRKRLEAEDDDDMGTTKLQRGLPKGRAAWQLAPVRIKLEETVQEWMQLACLSEPELATKARLLLADFHRHKHLCDVGEMLGRCYKPILWRHLTMANWKVRSNAVALLAVVFPLLSNPSSASAQESQEELALQYKHLKDSLTDSSEEVRKVAVGAVCRELATYWELISARQTAVLIAALVQRSARDKRCPAVRTAVLEGFRFILSNIPLS